MNRKKIAKAIGDAGKALQLLSEGLIEGEKLEASAEDLAAMAREIAKMVGMPNQRTTAERWKRTDPITGAFTKDKASDGAS